MREEYKEKVRDNILKTAQNLLKETDVQQVTIRSIAKELDMSVGSIYTYFLDKETILREVFAVTCSEFFEVLKSTTTKNKTDEEYYIDLVIVACDFRIQNSYRYQEISFGLSQENLEALNPIRSFMLSHLKKLKLPALSKTVNLEKADRTILALCEGVARLVSKKRDFEWKEVIMFAVKSLIESWKNNN